MRKAQTHVYLCVFVCLLEKNSHANWVESYRLTVLKIPNELKDKVHGYSHNSYYIEVCLVICYTCGACSQLSLLAIRPLYIQRELTD